jgi:plasmid stabilization system protein ParE
VSSQAVAHDIVWTAGAEADLLRLYEQVGDHDLAIKALREPLKRVLSLLAEYPALGARVHGTERIRRLLTGPGKRFGIFYVEEVRRIMIHALIDMRQNPELLRLRLGGL